MVPKTLNLVLVKLRILQQTIINSDGFTKRVDLMEILKLQCQSHFRSDANKINYLCKAVLSFSWDLITIRNIIAAKYSFNSFFKVLREHIQLKNEVSSSGSNYTISSANGANVDSKYDQYYG